MKYEYSTIVVYQKEGVIFAYIFDEKLYFIYHAIFGMKIFFFL